MSDSSNEFQQSYRELFKDVEKLNKYTRSNKVQLKNKEITEISLNGAEFHGAVFNNVKWIDSTLENSFFDQVVFENCEFKNTNLNGTNFKDCVFIKCKIVYTKLNRATCKNVEFVDCNIQNAGMNKWQGEGLVFNHSKILDTPIAQGRIGLVFKNTEMDGVQVVLAEGMFPLMVENCLLSEVDFGDSHFSDVVLRRVKQGEGGVKFNSVTAKSISFEDVEMLRGVGMGWANVALVRIVGGKLYGPAFKKANIAKTVIRDAYVTRFAIGNMDTVQVANSTLHRSGLFEGGIQEFSVVNSTVDEIIGKNFKANIVLWDNVTLDGKIDLTNAQVKDFRPTRLKRGPRLQLITTGSNIKFQ